MLSITVATHQELAAQVMAQDQTLILSHVLYKIQINRITIQQTAQPVQAIQINHLRAAAILQEQLHGAVIQRDHRHGAAPIALLRAIPEVHAHHLQVIRLQAVAVTAVEVLQVQAAAAAALVAQEAVRVVAHQVAAEDKLTEKIK